MRLIRKPQDRENGAIAIIVAVVLGPVLLSVGAIVVDVGHLYADRRQQQNAADAGALAVAHDCAVSATDCVGPIGQPMQTAQRYASGGPGVEGTSYGSGFTSHVTEVCGTAGVLAPCLPPSGDLDCANDPPDDPYVQVRTRTGDAAGTSLLLPKLSRILAGNGDDPGRDTAGCARAAVSLLGGTAPGLPLTLSYCEWKQATQNGTAYAPPPPYPPNPPTGVEQVLRLNSGSGGSEADETCDSSSSGGDFAGAFGWLDHDGECKSAQIDESGSYTPKPGDPGVVCRSPFAEVWEAKEPIFLPVYNDVSGQGNRGQYELEGFAAFVITGYDLASTGKKTSWLTDRKKCDEPGQKCLFGFFTQALAPWGTGGGRDLGAKVVTLIG